MLKFQVVKQTKTYAEIVEQISKLIEQGELKPGDRLPSERSLSSALSIGRQSLREALSVLEALGLLEVRHGIGTFVRMDAKANVPTISKESEQLVNPFELLEARRVIEPEMVSLAAKKATEQQVADMEQALKNLLNNSIPGKHAFALDRDVHLAFARGAQNEMLYRVMLDITEQMSEHLWLSMKEKSLEVSGRDQAYQNEHEEIFTAIKNRDSRKAARAMLTHLKNIENAFLERLS